MHGENEAAYTWGTEGFGWSLGGSLEHCYARKASIRSTPSVSLVERGGKDLQEKEQENQGWKRGEIGFDICLAYRFSIRPSIIILRQPVNSSSSIQCLFKIRHVTDYTISTDYA